MNVDVGILILRLALGLTMAGHGAQKLFGWFGGSGWQSWVSASDRMKLHPALLWALLGGMSEFGGGLLLALGFLSPLGSLGIIAAMVMAIRAHWPKGYWSTKGGFEYPLMNLVAALTIALAGPGAWSVDRFVGLALPEPIALTVGLLLVIAGSVAAILRQLLQPGSPMQAGHRSN